MRTILLLLLCVVPAVANSLPTLRLSCDPCTVAPGGTVLLTATASDTDGDVMRFVWDWYTWFERADDTRTDATPVVVRWTAPEEPGSYRIGVCVFDGSGRFVSRRLDINVRPGAPMGPARNTPSNQPGTPREHRPFAPRGLTAVGEDGEVKLRWLASHTGGGAVVTHYEYRVGRRHPWISTGSDATTHTVCNLVNGTTYVFEVRAVNAAGLISRSAIAQATPGNPLIFPHVASGLWATDLILVNPSERPAWPKVYFRGASGDLIPPAALVAVVGDLEVTEDGALTTRTAMEPLDVLMVSIRGAEQPLTASARVVSKSDVVRGMAQYHHPALGVVGVRSGTPHSAALAPVRRQADSAITTGIALYNPAARTIGISCELLRSGILIDNTILPLRAHGQGFWLLDEMFAADTSDFSGVIRCAATPGDSFVPVALLTVPDGRSASVEWLPLAQY